jgi:DUF1680 family protein
LFYFWIFLQHNADGVYVHLTTTQMNWHLHDGSGLKVQQKTNYPWSGDVKMTVSPATPKEFVMYVRIPGWSGKNSVKVNGKEIAGAKPGEYLAIRRLWAANDTIDLSFDMTTHLLEGETCGTRTVDEWVSKGPIVSPYGASDQPDHGVGMNLAGYTIPT